MKITIEEALVKTATVEIKTLSIAGRQVTLAVFRQLQEESVIDYELLRLNGPVWGRVNYHPGKCNSEDHIHLVWQLGTELRRSWVGEDSASYVMEEHRCAIVNEFYSLLSAFACKGAYFTKDDYWSNTKRFIIEGIEGNVCFENTSDPLRQLLTANAAIAKGIEQSYGKTNKQIAQESIAILKQRFPDSQEEVVGKIRNAQKERDAYKKDWEILYAKLKEVQQLFIAV